LIRLARSLANVMCQQEQCVEQLKLPRRAAIYKGGCAAYHLAVPVAGSLLLPATARDGDGDVDD